MYKNMTNIYFKWIEAEARNATMETEIRQKVTMETENKIKLIEQSYLEILEKQVRIGSLYFNS